MPKLKKLSDQDEFKIFMESIDGVILEDYLGPKHYVNTKFGALNVSIHDSDFLNNGMQRKKEIASIYCRFQDIDSFTKEQIEELDDIKRRLNKYSGKWNFHHEFWDNCFYVFKKELNRILIKN